MNNLNYDVVICTYNGAYFLSKQLKSILNQNILPANIILSDDASSDNTLDIAQKICKQFCYTGLNIIQGKQHGIIANFLSAITYAKSDYIFLADQDDIWFPNKAEKFLEAFTKLDQNQPALVFSDAQLIDENGQEIAPSFFAYQGLTPDIMQDDSILYRNCVQGASCAVNRQLQQILVDSLSKIEIAELYMHDWWIALIARYYGNYQFIEEPLLAYRQHNQNQVGVFNRKLRFLYYISRFRSYWKNFRQAIRQMKMFEQFTASYDKPHNLPERRKRHYQSVSRLKQLLLLWIR